MHFVNLFGLVCLQGFLETYDILRIYANDAAARTIDIRYEKKRDGHNKRQDDEPDGSRPAISRAIAD